MCLDPILEGGETAVSDGGGEVIPPLGGQTGEELVDFVLNLYLAIHFIDLVLSQQLDTI